MKHIRFLTFVLLLGTLVLSACGAAAAIPTSTPSVTASAGGGAMPVSFIGIVDSIVGDQWVISGTTVTIDPSIVRDGPFRVGDQVKVEGFVNSNGSFTVSRVEPPTPQETATLPPFGNDNSNDAVNNANTNDANINDGNVNDDNSNGGNSNDDNSNDSNSNDDNGSNSNDDNSNSGNDNGNDNNDNDGNDNDDNSNDDHGGGNSNDDDNSNDDHGGDNSNEDNDNDDGGNSNDD
jgi:hypothetical protein